MSLAFCDYNTSPQHKCVKPAIAGADYCEEHGAKMLEVKPVGTTGAMSSGSYLPYEQVPRSLTDAAARRLKKGQDKGYEVFNWRKGLSDPEFIRDRFRHFKNHIEDLVNDTDTEDDMQGNVDAMAWFVMLLCEADKDAVAKAFYHELRKKC